MKTPERFERAVKALVQAFFNDTLAKEDCTMCAVGNICEGKKDWSAVFITTTHFGQFIAEDCYVNDYQYRNGDIYHPKQVIDKTGYTWQELAKVEAAFESNTRIPKQVYYKYSKTEIMEDQFNGLMAVVDVLCEIDKIDPAPYKMKFEYNQELLPVNA